MGNCAQKKKDLETRKEYQLAAWGPKEGSLNQLETRDERGGSEATQSEGGSLPCPSAGQGNEVYMMTEQREHGASTALEGVVVAINFQQLCYISTSVQFSKEAVHSFQMVHLLDCKSPCGQGLQLLSNPSFWHSTYRE